MTVTKTAFLRCAPVAVLLLFLTALGQAPASALESTSTDPSDAPAGAQGETDLRRVTWDIGAATTTVTVSVDESTYGAGVRAELGVHLLIDNDADGLADDEIVATRNVDGLHLDVALRSLDGLGSQGDCQELAGAGLDAQAGVASTVANGLETFDYTFTDASVAGGLAHFRWAAIGQSPPGPSSSGPWDYLPDATNPDPAAANPGGRSCGQTGGGVRVRLANGFGLETVKPTVAPVVRSVPSGVALGSTRVPVRLSWSASDDTTPSSGLRYDVQVRDLSGAGWATVVTHSSARSAVSYLLPGRSYQIRHRAYDAAGNVSDYTYGAGFRPTLRQETTAVPALAYTGSWARVARSGASGGHVRTSTTAGATATLTFQGNRGVGVVMPTRPDLGRARVCLLRGATTLSCTRFDLSPAGSSRRHLLFARNGLDPSRTYQVRVAVVAGRADLDAFLVLS